MTRLSDEDDSDCSVLMVPPKEKVMSHRYSLQIGTNVTGEDLFLF